MGVRGVLIRRGKETLSEWIESIINMGMERVPLIRGRIESIINIGAEEVYIIRVNTRATP